jgi:hypothetical protein
MDKMEQTAIPGKANLEEMEEHFSKFLIEVACHRTALCRERI